MAFYEKKCKDNTNELYSTQNASTKSNLLQNPRYNLIWSNIKSGESFLDVGCGNGRFTILFKEKFKRVCGLDVSETAINNAILKKIDAKVCHFDKLDLEQLPFDENSFDCVLCSEVLEHILNFPKMLELIGNVIKPGGKLYLTVPNGGWWKYRLYILFGKSIYFNNKKLTNFTGLDNEHIRFLNMSDMRYAQPKNLKIVKTIPEKRKGFDILTHIKKSFAFRLLYIFEKTEGSII